MRIDQVCIFHLGNFFGVGGGTTEGLHFSYCETQRQIMEMRIPMPVVLTMTFKMMMMITLLLLLSKF